MSAGEKGRSYVLYARDEQLQYTSALLLENEKLRAAVATLESDRRRAEDQLRASVEELDRMRVQFDNVAQENQRYAEQYQQIETHSSNLANLYVASYQLHTSVERDVVLQTILEIVINLIGSEQVAVYERDGAEAFRLASSFGIYEGMIGKRRSSDEIFADAADESKLTACIPLKIGDETIGAIMIFRLLDHKASLQPVDHELFDLLAVHASTALHCASLHEQTLAVAR